MDATASVRRGIHRRIEINITDSLRTRFERMVTKAEPDQCWPWRGATRDGYGAIGYQTFERRRHVLGAHCVSYVLANGCIPDGCLVLHSCDNRICCNPNHLYAGSHSQNMKDMFARGRRCLQGELAPSAKLTNSQAALIKAVRIETGFGWRRISRILPFGVCSIRSVIEQRGWTHIPWPSNDEARQKLESEGFRHLLQESTS